MYYYVQQVKQERRAIVATSPLNDIALSRSPNFMHKNGRIYASKDGEPYVAVSVSPYNDNFETQIEKGVWPIVEGLLLKNYLTLSSCEGHNIRNSHLYVMVVFGDEESSINFVDHFKDINGVTFSLNRSMANNKQVVNGSKVGWVPLDPLEHSVVEEYKDLNRMFGRRHEQYWFVQLKLFANRPGIKNFFWNISNQRNKRQYQNQSKQIILERIQSLPIYLG